MKPPRDFQPTKPWGETIPTWRTCAQVEPIRWECPRCKVTWQFHGGEDSHVHRLVVAHVKACR